MNDVRGAEGASLEDIAARIKLHDEREAMPGKAVRDALRSLLPLVNDNTALPYLFAPQSIEHWRVLQNAEPETFVIHHSEVARRHGRDIALLLSRQIGPPGQVAKREIALLTPAEIRARAVPLDLVRDIIPSRGVAACVGGPGSGKSFLMFDLGAAIARGARRWFGKRAKAGGVIYLGAEGTWSVRQRAYEQHHGVSLDGAKLRIIEQAVDLLRSGTEGDVERLVELIQAAAAEMGGVVLIIIDTLNRTMPGGNENAPDDMGAYIQNVAYLAAMIGALVIVIHHTGKNEAAGARGHSSLYGALDCELTVTKDASGKRSFRTSKQRDGADDQGAAFRLEVVDLGPHPDPDADPDERLTSCVIVPEEVTSTSPEQKAPTLTDGEKVALDALREVLAEAGQRRPATSTLPSGVVSGSVESWRVRVYGRLGSDKADMKQDSKSKTFRRALSRLQAKKIIGVWEDYAWIW